MQYLHKFPDYRIGDEIQTTAVIKYLKNKGNDFFYIDCNKNISAKEFFPEGLVKFVEDVPENDDKYKKFYPKCIWIWSTMLKEKGVFTELSKTYNESEADTNIVFFPLLAPEYNQTRGVQPPNAWDVFCELESKYGKVKMIIDESKKEWLDVTGHPDVVYTSSIKEAFSYIHKSKIFIGGDTGVSHYAGAIKHPRMILTMPNQNLYQLEFARHKVDILQNFPEEKDLLFYQYSSLPCCDPKQYNIVDIQFREIPIKNILQTIDAL